MHGPASRQGSWARSWAAPFSPWPLPTALFPHLLIARQGHGSQEMPRPARPAPAAGSSGCPTGACLCCPGRHAWSTLMTANHPACCWHCLQGSGSGGLTAGRLSRACRPAAGGTCWPSTATTRRTLLLQRQSPSWLLGLLPLPGTCWPSRASRRHRRQRASPPTAAAACPPASTPPCLWCSSTCRHVLALLLLGCCCFCLVCACMLLWHCCTAQHDPLLSAPPPAPTTALAPPRRVRPSAPSPSRSSRRGRSARSMPPPAPATAPLPPSTAGPLASPSAARTRVWRGGGLLGRQR